MRSAPRSPVCTLQPSARSASSMTRVSSESQQARAPACVPSARPASSSTRLEMLFEPGSRTVPEAPRSGGRSRKGMSNIGAAGAGRQRAGGTPRRAHLPAARRPSLATRSSSSSASAVAGLHHLLQRVERLAEALRLLQHLFAVGHQDVAPHRRVAGGDAREVAEARPGQRQEVASGRLVEHAAEVGEGQQVRQVADGGEGGVVVLGRHLQHLRADGRPDVGGLLHQRRRGLRQRRQDHLAAAVQRRIGMLDARRLPCRRSGAPARSWRRARAARGARHRRRRAWCCPRP